MYPQRKFGGEDNDACASTSSKGFFDITTSDRNRSKIESPVQNIRKPIVITLDADDEVHSNYKLPVHEIWQEVKNEPKIWGYNKTSGIEATTLRQLGTNTNELSIFNIIFDNRFWENIVTETNRYAEQIKTKPKQMHTIDKNWCPVDYNEIKLYCALSILMAYVTKPSIEMYWSEKNVIGPSVFRKMMPLNRYLEISRCLHFTNNNMHGRTDELSELRPVINFFNKKFKEVYTMQQDIAIGESLLPYKESMSYKQLKLYKLCESDSGYCYNFEIYTNYDKINSDDSAFESVLRNVLQSVLHKGHTLYINNRCSSPKLFRTLSHLNETNVIGTVYHNRKDLPTDLCMLKLKKGNCKMRSSNGILIVKWKEERDMYIMSTKHETVEMTADGTYKDGYTLKPKCVIEYNKGMIGIDRQDQMISCFPIMGQYLKGHRKIFFDIFNIALFNSYILFGKINNSKNRNYVEYVIEIAEALLKNTQKPDYNQPGPSTSSENLPERLHAKHWRHFPKHIDPIPSKLRPSRPCEVCVKNKRYRETMWECKKCKVALHIPRCFEIYHTRENY